MKKYLNQLTENKLLLFSLLFVAATVFYLFNIGFSDLWSDETYTKSMLTGSLPDFFAKFKNDLHPPLYYLGLRWFTALFGLSPLSLRLFSVLGVLSTLLLGYFAGQRVFGKQGALYFCLMVISIPMLAAYSHQARMYTWAAFSTTGVFLYAYLFIKTGKYDDLALLFVFTLTAMYMHYYSMGAALVANVFVLLYLVLNKNGKWVPHLFSFLLEIVLFLPWVFMFLVQVKKVQHAFWVPPVSLATIFPCFTIPFTEQFWTTGYSHCLVVLTYLILVITLFKSLSKSSHEHRLALWLSMTIFLGTLLLFVLVSLFSQPILFSRYMMAIVIMLAVPSTIFFMQLKMKWLKILLLSIVVFLGVRIAISTSYFSYGPYRQAVEYIGTAYPEVSKILHLTEITAGPMVEYNGNSGLEHYWLKAEMSNVDAFTGIHQYNRPGEFLQPGELFCTVRFNGLELNKEKLDLILTESDLIKTDTVSDNKVEYGNIIQVYLLKYKGN